MWCLPLHDELRSHVFVAIPALFRLLGGHVPAQGYETNAWECFGIACIFWGLLIACKASDKAVLTFDLVWNIFWVAQLGMLYLGKPWRAAGDVGDASWAVVPVVAHTVFAVFDRVAIGALGGKAKSS